MPDLKCMATSATPPSSFILRFNRLPVHGIERSYPWCTARVRCSSFLIFPLLILVVPNARTQGRSDLREITDKGLQLAQIGEFTKAKIELRHAMHLFPNETTPLVALGDVLAMQNRFSEANVYFEKALKINPHDPDSRRHLAASQWQLDRLPQARENLQRVLRDSPNDEQSTLLLGMVEESLKDYRAAARLLGSVPQLVRNQPAAVPALVHCYYEISDKDRVHEQVGILVNEPSDPQAPFLVARVATEANDYETAEKLLASIRSTYPDAEALGYQIAVVQYRTGRFGESQGTLLDLIKGGRQNARIYNLLGWCFEKQGQPDEAVRALKHAINLDTTAESNYIDLAHILVAHHLLSSALELARKVVDSFPSSSDAYSLKGMIEIEEKNYVAAVQSYTRAAQLNEMSPEKKVELARAQAAAGLYDEAAATLRKGITKFPRDARHYQEYGLMLLKRGEKGDARADARAFSLLQTAVALDRSLWVSHYELGKLWLKKGKPSEAVQGLETASTLNPENGKIHYALWRAFRSLGQTKEATKERERFQSLEQREDHSYNISWGLMVHIFPLLISHPTTSRLHPYSAT
jgi:tetratricopeptide (TPR) repeat protein